MVLYHSVTRVFCAYLTVWKPGKHPPKHSITFHLVNPFAESGLALSII